MAPAGRFNNSKTEKKIRVSLIPKSPTSYTIDCINTIRQEKDFTNKFVITSADIRIQIVSGALRTLDLWK